MRKTRMQVVGVMVGGLVAASGAHGQDPAPLGPVRASLAVAEARVALVGHTLEAAAPQLAAVEASLGGWGVIAPMVEQIEARAPEAWLRQDPADSLYREAREALNRGNYDRAAILFRDLRRRFPRSGYVADSYYWEAFARYRDGGEEQDRAALDLLRRQGETHPDAETRASAEVLATRIRGRLAAAGDAPAAERVAVIAAPPAPPAPAIAPPGAPAIAPRPAAAPQFSDQDDDIRIAALNALLQMDAEQAIPILKQILERRDAGSTRLRRKAVFLVSQKRSPETETILLNVIRNDPDSDVRAQGVFWLSQVPTENAVAALDSILMASDDRQVQKKAIFALSQHNSERAGRALRAYAQRRDAPEELRRDAIFWLGQHSAEANQAFLRQLYPSLQSSRLKERVIFAISQRATAENQRWLLDLARNSNESIEMRKKALFWAGQSGVAISELVSLYSAIPDREMREQLIFVYSQRSDGEAVDKLMDIARNDPSPELQKKAVFWLGQSKDPRVAQFLLEIINR